jgi:hypothetical protein
MGGRFTASGEVRKTMTLCGKLMSYFGDYFLAERLGITPCQF